MVFRYKYGDSETNWMKMSELIRSNFNWMMRAIGHHEGYQGQPYSVVAVDSQSNCFYSS